MSGEQRYNGQKQEIEAPPLSGARKAVEAKHANAHSSHLSLPFLVSAVLHVQTYIHVAVSAIAPAAVRTTVTGRRAALPPAP
jgi:hypothetical protein